MAPYALDKIRNVVLLSHSGAGKTSTAEAMLFVVKAINRLGRVDDGTTTSDYDPDEIKRKISINLTILPSHWQDIKINILDTPGYPEFVGEVRAGMRVSEGAIVLVEAASGVEVGTEQVWSYCDEANLPRIIFINKMDRENADFHRTLEQVRAKFGARCVPIQLPIGAQSTFQGLIDLLTMKSYLGAEMKEAEIPAPWQKEADSLHEKLVEAVAETEDRLVEKYLGGEPLTLEELVTALHQAVISGKIVPVLAGAALQTIGISTLFDAICRYLPSPKEGTVAVVGAKEPIQPSPDGPLAALVFKTSADPYVGKLTYFRVYTGTINSNSPVWNCTQNGAERIGQLFLLRGKTQEPVPQVGAGDIGAVAKLNVTSTGDTLGHKDNPIKLAPITFPEPIFSVAVYPKTKADLDKLGAALSRITEEDPTLRVRREPGTGETLLLGMGETHLAVAGEKMTRKFGINVNLETPKVPYRETVTISTEAEYRHKKQTGGHGQFGHVFLRLEPLPRGSGNEFADKVVGGTIPRNYIPAVEKGVIEAEQEGVIAGYPVVDVKATVYDGSFHPVDSSDICFKIAGAGALKKGLAQAQPILLEPIMNIKVTIPDEYTGDIIGDLNTKRGRILGMNPSRGTNVIEAQVPQAEILRYAIDLKSITQGKGTYTVSFSHYEPVPPQVTQKVIAEREARKAAEAR